MGLETGNYLNDLVSTNPTPSDPKSQGDDHLRLIKAALKTCFSGFAGPVAVTASDTGAANAYVLTPSPVLIAYVASMLVLLKPANSNTAASTININGLGAKAIQRVDGSAVTAGELAAGSYYLLAYNGTAFNLVSGPTKQYVDQQIPSMPSLTGNAGRFLATDGLAMLWRDGATVWPVSASGPFPTQTATLSLTPSYSGKLLFLGIGYNSGLTPGNSGSFTTTGLTSVVSHASLASFNRIDPAGFLTGNFTQGTNFSVNFSVTCPNGTVFVWGVAILFPG